MSAIGDAVMLRADLYEGADDCNPGGYLARRGEKLIVRGVRERGEWPVSVSHEGRADSLTFSVAESEIEPYAAPQQAEQTGSQQ